MSHPTMNHDFRDGRTLLKALGIGDFNATMIIQSLWIAPAITDPKSPPIMLLVQALQRNLGLPATGYLDPVMAASLRKLAGPGWMHLPWATSCEAVLAGGRQREAVSSGITKFVRDPHQARSLAGVFDALPDVPGGLLTYGVGAFLLYRHFSKR